MNLQMRGGWVLLRKVEDADADGVVLAAGPDTGLKAGAKVIYRRATGTMGIDGKEMLVVEDGDIIAEIVEEGDAKQEA